MPLKPTETVPKAPTWLNKESKRKWKEAATLLCEAGVLTALDLDALAAFCTAYATWKAAASTVEAEGVTYTTESGQKKPHPAVLVMLQADRAVLAWASKLGLHVAARRGLRIELDGALGRDRSKARFFPGADDGPKLADFIG